MLWAGIEKGVGVGGVALRRHSLEMVHGRGVGRTMDDGVVGGLRGGQ